MAGAATICNEQQRPAMPVTVLTGLPRYPNNRAPQFNFDNGQLVIPHPPTSREEIQEPFIRETEIPPAEYYPAGYEPLTLFDWPVDGDLVVPLDAAPEELTSGMSENWRQRKAYLEATADAD